MGDLSDLFKEAVASEIEQQKSTDWKSILAQSLADTSKNYSQEFAEGQRTQGDWGSRLALSILGGAGRGFAARQSQNISEDVNNKFLSGIDQYESGKAKSLASALSGLGLESAASGVGAFDTQRRLERLQKEQDLKMGNQLEIDQYGAMTPLALDRFKQQQAITFEQEKALQGIRNQGAIDLYNQKQKAGGGGILNSEQQKTVQDYRQAILNDPSKDKVSKQMALAQSMKMEMPKISDNAALLSAQALMRTDSLKKSGIGEYGLKIEEVVPVGSRKDAFKELGFLNKQKYTMSTIDDVFNKIAGVSTLGTLQPYSEDSATFAANKSSLETNVMEPWKGVMSKDDRKSVEGLFPDRFDSKERLIIKRDAMKQALRNIAQNAAPTLSAYGIYHPQMIGDEGVSADQEVNQVTKNVNGVTYKKVAGGWEAIE
jgi:hypothetical protein